MSMNRFMWHSLKTRVTLFTLVIFFVGIWSLAFYASRILRRDMQTVLSEQQFSTVSIMASNVNQELAVRLQSIEKTAAQITPATLNNSKSIQRFLEDRYNLQILFNGGAYITGLDGTAIADVPISTGRIGMNSSDRGWMIDALKGKTTVGKPVIGKKLQVPVFSIATPIRDMKGNVIGVLVGVVDLSKPNFLEGITNTRYGKTGAYLLIAPQHKLFITGTDKTRIMQPVPATGINPLFDRYVQGFEGSGIVTDSRGLEVMSSAKQISVAGWILVARIPTAEAFAPIRNMMWRILLVAIFLSLLAACTVWWLLKRQLAPVFTTIKTLATLSDTEHPPQALPITRQDEIGDLIGGFNRLLETLGQRKEALRVSEGKYRSLFNNAEVGIFRTRLDGSEVLEVNQRFLDIVGMTLDETVGKPSVNVWADPKEREEMVKMLLADGSVSAFEYKMLNKRKGEVRNCLTSLRLYREQGILEGTILDITERKRAEKALRESEERYQSLLEQAGDGIFILDTAGKILSVNKSFADMHGFTIDEVLRMGLDGLDVEGSAPVLGRVRRIMAGETLSFEVEHYHKDGHTFPLAVTANLVSTGDEKLIIGIHHDLSFRKQVEEEKRDLLERLQRAEKMEALGQLAGGVAHDLNNVLGILSGYSELLLDEIPEGSKSRGHVEKILKSTKKGAAIIDDLLTLARRGVTATDVIDLNGVVSDFLTTPAFENIKDYNPRVTFRTECDEPMLNIKGSPIHLEKTLMNLVSNAAEAISGEGTVTIRTEGRYLEKPIKGYDEIQEGEYVVLIVSDTGTGIPADSREKIFEPFYTKKKMGRSGTGLGLSIVWGTVKDHNGYIDLQTEEGKGTTFSLYFPITREEPVAPEAGAPVKQYVGKGETVLVVDDRAGQREIASLLITKLGYQVHTVASGEDAAEYLKSNKADILVLDMIMPPGMDGLETYKRILEISPKQKAIIVSGFSANERVKEAQRLGAGVYIKKPYETEKIGMAIRNELRGVRDLHRPPG